LYKLWMPFSAIFTKRPKKAEKLSTLSEELPCWQNATRVKV
jgi:hypothetical protein